MLRFGGRRRESRQRQRRGQRRRALREDRRGEPRPASASRPRPGTRTALASRPGRLQPGQQRRQPGHRHPVLADARAAGVQHRHGHRQHARQEPTTNCAAELQRALRVHRQAVHALRLLERRMSRPDFGLLRNSVAINAPPHRYQQQLAVSDPQCAGRRSPATTSCSRPKPATRASSPSEADNFDLSYEAYLEQEQLVHARPVLQAAGERRSPTAAPCATSTTTAAPRTVTIRGPSNDPSSGGTLKGFEVAYQTFFDFLPGAWAGLGVQLNYTHTIRTDINNSNLAVQAGYLPGSTTAFGGGNNTSTGGAGQCRQSAVVHQQRDRLAPARRHLRRLVQRRRPVRVRQGRRARWRTAGARNS